MFLDVKRELVRNGRLFWLLSSQTKPIWGKLCWRVSGAQVGCKNLSLDCSFKICLYRAAGEFLDVTVACEDGSVDLHKLVLSANSSFFRRILNKQKDSQCYIFIRGLAFQDLMAIVNFMYLGEIKVPGESLERFIQAAQDLDIRGLGADQIKGSVTTEEDNRFLKPVTSASSLRKNSSFKTSTRLEAVKEIDEKNVNQNESELYEVIGAQDENLMNCSFGTELSQINDKMNKMKQLKINNIRRIRHSLNDNYNPNDTLDSVLPHGENEEEDTFDEEMAEEEQEDVSTDSAMVIDGSAASDQNAQLELEISMRMTKIR